MRSLSVIVSALTSVSLVLLCACGDNSSASKIEGGAGASGGTVGDGKAGSANAGALSLGGSLNEGDPAGGGASGNGGGETCAATSQEAQLTPVYLVFLLDESGSMGDGTNGADPATRWNPVTTALKAFFADPASQGIMASLSIFPLDQNKTTNAADQNLPPSCSAGSYTPPLVPPTLLPDSQTLPGAITALYPPNEYGTPTLPALSGTIAYAESLLTEDATRKVAIVMVTDGEPSQCNGNDIPGTALAATAVKDHIPTYVIGVGNSLDSLNAIAVGGGTEKAFIVAVNDPDKTRKDFADAIELIRGKAISCELALPPAPPGKQLDPNKVNVQLTGGGQAGTNLKYGTECTGDTAWHYDDPAKPTKVLLCEGACTAVKADVAGKLDVVFGCVDREVVK